MDASKRSHFVGAFFIGDVDSIIFGSLIDVSTVLCAGDSKWLGAPV